MRIILLLLLALTSCIPRAGHIKKTDDGVEFHMRKVGKVSYKDKDVEAEMDTRKPSVLEDIIKIYTLKLIEED